MWGEQHDLGQQLLTRAIGNRGWSHAYWRLDDSVWAWQSKGGQVSLWLKSKSNKLKVDRFFNNALHMGYPLANSSVYPWMESVMEWYYAMGPQHRGTGSGCITRVWLCWLFLRQKKKFRRVGRKVVGPPYGDATEWGPLVIKDLTITLCLVFFVKTSAKLSAPNSAPA